MGKWDDVYSKGSINTAPSRQVVELIPRLKSEGVYSVLDAGCGTGRHAQYLAEQGFDVHGIDISEKAIQIAEARKNGCTIDYRAGTLADLPYGPESMDFILASHVLEYASDDDVQNYFAKLHTALKKGRPFFARVVSTQHVFNGARPEDVYGFSHVGFCIKNGLPVHFFSEEEMRRLFESYEIKTLQHIAHKVKHVKITVPLMEWALLGYKK